MDWLLVFGISVRVFIVILGLAAMLALAWGRAKRSANWTGKMKDIWLCHFLFVYANTQANVELAFRHVLPTLSSLFIVFVLFWTIKGVFNGDFYTKDQAYCYHEH